MALWAKLILIGLSLVSIGLGLAIWVASTYWNQKTSESVEKLLQLRRNESQKTVNFKDLEQLPSPVSKYFRWALKEGQPTIRSASITQVGKFRIGKTENSWSPMQAKQYFSADSPGFVWSASIPMAPLMDVRVRDAYLTSEGVMQAKLLSLVPLVNQRGTTELNMGALQRYLAEAVWFPTALLPSAGVKWSAIDNNRALATLTDFNTTVSLEFHFNDIGQIQGVFTPGRYREVNGQYKLTPWAGYFRNYQERDGMQIPLEADVEWQLSEGSFPYFQGQIVAVKYDFVE